MSNPTETPHKACWWKVSVTCPEVEDESYQLFELGAKGTELQDTNTLHAFFETDLEQLETVLTRCRERGFAILSYKEVIEEDWVGQCEEIWKPVSAGEWTVEPFLTEKHPEETEAPAKVIRIRPGLGFGTGHHSTTRTTLEFLQLPEHHPESVCRVLDLGTGSGILAIAAAKIFSKPVVAIDIDDAALGNARHNAQLNNCENLIEFSQGSVEQSTGSYEIVIANIYAEVLVDLCQQICNAVKDNGILFLSGIREDKKGMVISAYQNAGMREEVGVLSEGWHSVVLKRK